MKSLTDGTVIAGKYRLDRRIGEGGMGAVWSGHHLALDIPIAVKFMDPALLERSSEGWAQRFEREAKAAAKLRHPQVVQVFDYGVDDGTPYTVMEQLDGEDLSTRMKRRGTMSLEETAWVLRETARPLQRAHDLGIVHRDLKPGNLFVAKIGDDETIKVLDFGVAKAPLALSEEEHTKTGDLLGSPLYMSPEQASESRDVDHRTDLWALAVICYRALTGRPPWDGSITRVLLQICNNDPPPPRRYRPGLPEAIDGFFVKAFAKDPGERFQSARDMASAFNRIAGVADPSQPSLRSASVHDLDWSEDGSFRSAVTAPTLTGPVTVVGPAVVVAGDTAPESTLAHANRVEAVTRPARGRSFRPLVVGATVVALAALALYGLGRGLSAPEPAVEASAPLPSAPARSAAASAAVPAPSATEAPPAPSASALPRPARSARPQRVAPPRASTLAPSPPVSEFGY